MQPESARTCAPRPNSRSGVARARAGRARAPRRSAGSELRELCAGVCARREVDDDAAPLGSRSGGWLRAGFAPPSRGVEANMSPRVEPRVHAAERGLVAGERRPSRAPRTAGRRSRTRRRRASTGAGLVERDASCSRRGARGARSAGGTGSGPRRDDPQAVLLREHLEVGMRAIDAVLVHDLADDAGGREAGEAREIDASPRSARCARARRRARAQREDVAGA